MNTNMVLLFAWNRHRRRIAGHDAPAVVAWATHLAWLDLYGSYSRSWDRSGSGSFHDRSAGEFVGDQLPKTPARTTAGPLAARIVMGALTGRAWPCQAELL